MAFSLDTMVPAAKWLRIYQRSQLRGDLIAGVTVAIMLVPQGMAYAMLAGLPPVIGLYASTVPLIIYALFGSSRHLAVGPVAMISLLVYVACSKLADPGSQQYFAYALLLAFMVGIIQLLLGFMRLGVLENFFSHAVISGFSSAAAIIICVSQLKHLLGITLTTSHSVFEIMFEVIGHLDETNPVTFLIGISSIAFLIFFKKKFPLFPVPLLVVLGSTVLVYSFALHSNGVQTVGEVPRGLPTLSIPEFHFSSIRLLLPTALTIFFVGIMESISVAEFVAAKKKYAIDPNQELKGLGLSNVAGAFFSCYPVTGGFSRTAVNYQAGAQTALASLITAGIVLLTLLFLTPLFYYLPNCVLAAIIIVAVVKFIDVKEAQYFYRIKKSNGLTVLLTFVATLAIGVEQGILIGVIFSLFLFIWRSSRPNVAELGYFKEEGIFRDVGRFPEEVTFPHVLILRVDASLYFANMKFLEDALRARIEEKPQLKWILFDFSGVNDMDAVAVKTLEEMMDVYRERSINFIFAAMKGPVRDLVKKAGWYERYGEGIQYYSIQHALRGIGIIHEK